jgi:hypothetical protein
MLDKVQIYLFIAACLGCNSVALAQPAFDCASVEKIDWGYPDGYPTLAAFRLYLSRTSGGYHFGQPFGDGGYVWVTPGMPSMITEVLCEQIIPQLLAGTWYMVATAVSMNLKDESDPSNEISFIVGGKSPPIPKTGGISLEPRPPLQPSTFTPPVSSVPQAPPPLRATVSRPSTSPSDSGGGSFTDHCMWTGSCR